MSAAEFTRMVATDNDGVFSLESTACGDVWLHWNDGFYAVRAFIPVAKARELAAALTAAADATDEATREAESAVKL